MSDGLIISASFSPSINKWTGFCVEMGESGTHKDYNVIYNGDCISERFDTEEEAKAAARTKYERLNTEQSPGPTIKLSYDL